MRVQTKLPAEPEFDEDGLLTDPAVWTEALARDIARREGIGDLREDHWRVIRTLREHYTKFGVVPAMSHVCRAHDQDKQWVHDLFHTCLQAWRVAGLPNPGEEAKAYLSGM